MKKPVILAVDDTPVNLDIVLDTLGETYDISIATDGAEALAIAEELRPDIILLDVMMPGMDGYEVCRRLKQREAIRTVPVVFLTAKTGPEDLLKGFDVGGVDYVTKPFKVMELKARVDAHLELHRNRATIIKQNTEQRELLHVLCHDLANPMSNILNALRLLREETEADLREEYTDLMERSVSHGLDVIDIVRTMRMVEEKPLPLGPVDIGRAARDSISLLYHMIPQKSIDLHVDIPPRMLVRAEKTTLVNSVLNNLLSNAVKFSYPHGRVMLRASYAQSEGDPQGLVCLEVEDQGIGIPDGLKKDLFDVRKATNRDGTQGEIGTGFGMPLVRRFMLAYGGDIAVRSRPEHLYPDDHGTVVSLTFKTATSRLTPSHVRPR